MLAAAAVIGRSFSFQLLSEISRIDVDELFAAIEKAQQMGIVVPSSEGPDRPFAFAHELVRQTLLTEISAPRRQQLHASVADAIERLHAGAAIERAGDIADHLRKAGSFGDDRRLVHYLTIAGKGALEAGAFEEARRSFSSALSDQKPINSGERADLLANFAAAERGLERRDAAIAHLREALQIYIDLGDREMIARGYADLTDALSWAAQFHEAIAVARRGLAHLQDDLSSDRVRLLAATAEALTNTASYEPAQEALKEAFDIASKLSDPKLESRLLAARAQVNNQLLRVREVVNDGFRSEQLTGLKAPSQRIMQLLVMIDALLSLGRLEEAVRIADELEPLAKKISHPYAVAVCHSTRAWNAFGREPDLSKLEANLQEASKPENSGHSPYWEFTSHLDLGLVNFYCGDWNAALLHNRTCSRLETGSALEGLGTGLVFRQLAYAGDRDGALAILHEKRACLPRGSRPNAVGLWWMLALAIEGLVILGEHAQAGELYSLSLELLDTGVVLFSNNFRFTQTIAGIAAGAAGRWKAAEDHFRMATDQAESLPFRLEKAEVNRFHAMMLLNRAEPGDYENAQELLRQALASYGHFGMPRHVEITQALLDPGTPAKPTPLLSASTRVKK
jgi:tetratricopeptide (TPR) repeat protein